MKIFEVGFKSSTCSFNNSVNMIWANTGKEERQAVEETAARKAERYGYEVAFVTEISEAEAERNIRRGMPYYSIDEQAERDHDPSFPSEEEVEVEAEQAFEDEAVEEISAEMMVSKIEQKVEATKARSAWDRGVKEYAEELVENLREAVDGGYIEADDISNRRLLEKALLNGADSWRQYSEGGCSLCYDGQIARRLCAPWELKKTDNGRKDPNPRESWIDVQSRALFQAAQLILGVAF